MLVGKFGKGTFLATGPTSIGIGETTSFSIVMQIDPNVSGAARDFVMPLAA